MKKPKRKKNPLRSVRQKPVRSSFEETPLGDFLTRYCPVEYEMIRETARTTKRGITASMVEDVINATQNPMTDSLAYRKALGDFRRYRTKTPNKGMIDVESETELIKEKLGLD